MKKKMILILTIVSLMVVAFSITASASNYIDLSDLELSSGNSVMLDVFLNTENFESSVSEEIFGITYYQRDDIFYFGYMNVEYWHYLITLADVEFSNLSEWLFTNSYANESSMMCFYLSNYSKDFEEVYNQYLTELNAPTYEEGAALGYSSGKEAGKIEGYTNGYNAGKLDYKKTGEYNDAIEAAKTEGYEAGLADGEASSTNLLAIIVPVLVICGVLCVTLTLIRGKKRRYR